MVNTALPQDIKEQEILAQIQNLLKDLQKCAPHPDRPDNNAPEFIQMQDHYSTSSDYDGALGSMMIDSMLGSSFFSAANDLMESTSEILKDRSKAKQPVKLGQRNIVSNHFNTTGSKGPEWQAMLNAYMSDMPKRNSIEKWLAHHSRKLYAIRKNAILYPSIAA